MKHSIFYFLFLFSVLAYSCKDDDPVPVEDNLVEVTFRLEGEMSELPVSVLDSGDEKPDLYGIEVVHADGSHYAYGLFDDISLAKVKLRKGEKYTFRLMAVPDGKELCYSHNYGGYWDIFCLETDRFPGTGGGSPLTNNFIYREDEGFWCFDNPNYSYYYKIYAGYSADYLVEGDEILRVSMDRMFGTVKLVTEDLKTGKLAFQFLSDDGLTSNIPFLNLKYSLTPEKLSTEFFYSLRYWGNQNDWMPDDFSFTTKYIVRWVDDNGQTTDLGIHTMTIQRNRETTVVLNMSELLK